MKTDGHSRAEVAYRHLKRLILSAQMRPDSVIDEKGVAAELGMSRTPVRQAIGRLDQEGFVRVLPQRGTLVAPLSVADIQQVYLMRSLVEPAAAAVAAQRATAEDVAMLQEAEKTYLRELAENGDRSFHTLFHVAVAEVAGISRLTRIVRELQEQTEWYLALGDAEGRQNPSPHTHQLLIDAIAANDVEGAREISRSSILSSRSKILAGIGPDAGLLVAAANVVQAPRGDALQALS